MLSPMIYCGLFVIVIISSIPNAMCKLKFIPKIVHCDSSRITALSITTKKTQINSIKSTITILSLLLEHLHQTESVRSG